MTAYEPLLAAVTQHPEDDAARLAFAEGIRAYDPDRAAFIDQQIDQARRRRSSGRPASIDGNP